MAQSAIERVPAEQSEWNLRCELAAAYRIFAHWGWDDLVFTHLSVRVPGDDHRFLLNPFNLAFEEITASSLVKVDEDGRPVDDADALTNPAGFLIHSAVHMSRPDAACIMHLHTLAGQAVSCLADGLASLCQTAMIAGSGGVAYHEFEGIARDLDERARIAADLGDAHVLILRNHGTLTTGRSVGEAFLRMYFLERACQVQMGLAAASSAIHEAPAGMREFVAAQTQRDFTAAASLAWPAAYRKIERLFPETFR